MTQTATLLNEKDSIVPVTSPSGFDDASAPKPRMDGGWLAWSQVFGCWLLFINTWGLTNSYGVFETYYTTTFLPNQSPSQIAWIGSCQTFLLLFIGVFAGVVLDAGYLRPVLFLGSFLETLGMFMTSLGSKYWQLLLTQGICVGIGSGLLAFTSVALIPRYFDKKRMLAAGLVATGSAFAGIFYPFMMRQLIVKIGFPWSVRAMSFVMLTTLSIACVILKPYKIEDRKKGPFFDVRFIKDPSYLTFIVGYSCSVAGVYIPYFFVQDYALALGINEDMAFNVLSIMNAASAVGRILPNVLADRYGGITVLVPSCFFAALALYFWYFVHDLVGLIMIGIIYCLVTGGLVSLPPITIANMTEDSTQIGTRMGLGYTVAAIGALVGNPIAGAARRSESQSGISGVQHKYEGTWFFAGSALLAAAVLMVLSRYLRHGTSLVEKM